MSTKTLTGPLPYLAASVIVHAAAMALMIAWPQGAGLFSTPPKSRISAPVMVDLVELPPPARGAPGQTRRIVRREDTPDIIELMPDAKGTQKRPEKTRRYASRSMTVEKEIIPAAPAGPPQAKAAPAGSNAGAAGKNAGGTAGGRGGERAYTDLRPRETGKGTVIIEEGGGSGGSGPLMEAKADDDSTRLFPTGDRLKQLTREYEKAAPEAEKGKVLSLNTTELKYHGYLLGMKRRIEVYWDYPQGAAKRGEQGRLMVDFKIDKDGTVKDIKVVKSSNYPALDDAAVTAIRLAAPFNSFPGNFTIEDLSVHASFQYDLVYQRGGY